MRQPRRFTRTRTGCLTCRRRRKKCDQGTPICSGCFRNQLTCSWPSEIVIRPGDPLLAGVQYPVASSSGAPTVTADSESTTGLGATSTLDLLAILGPSDVPPGGLGYRTVGWDPASELFIADTRAPLVNPSARFLLRHYLESTSALLAAMPMRSNPFVTHIIPLAHCDDLLMHAVLALSGSHYICRNSAATEIRQSTWQHYALVISSLRGEIQRLGRKSPEESLRLLATLMVLCHIEVLSGESQGGVFAHLRASRQLILELLQGPAQCKNEEDQDLRGFVLETYAYLVLVANITPYGIVEGRTLPFDDFVTSLESLQQYKTFGTFMGCGYSLFEKIADVSRFSTRRLHEEKSGGVSQESLDTYEALLSSITSWEPTDSGPDASSWEAYRAIAGEVYKHALLIYLKASMCGTVVDNPKVICDIQQYIDICLGLLLKLDRSPFSTIMMWPLMIVGSCLIRVDQRLDLRERCQNSSFQMTHVSKAADLLQLVWEDPDKRSYGPYGLQLAMEKHGINFGMA